MTNDEPVIQPDEAPWSSERCYLDRLLVLAVIMGPEKPCDRCNLSRAKCGGLPRADGDPRP